MTVNSGACVSLHFRFNTCILKQKYNLTLLQGDKRIKAAQIWNKNNPKTTTQKMFIAYNNFWTFNVHLLHPLEVYSMLVMIIISCLRRFSNIERKYKLKWYSYQMICQILFHATFINITKYFIRIQEISYHLYSIIQRITYIF